MLLNTFHREHILLILKIKKLLRKIKSKNLTAGVFFLASLDTSAWRLLEFLRICNEYPNLVHWPIYQPRHAISSNVAFSDKCTLRRACAASF